MNRFVIAVLACSLALPGIGQIRKGSTYKVVPYDSTYGILMYEKLNFYLGGDSVRYDVKGYSASGWYEDYWEGGQVLHKGYYVEGHLKVYKNFYEHGQVEREFKSEFNKGSMNIYYPSGKPRAQIEYESKSGQAEVIRETDYFENGQVEFTEEYDKDGVYVVRNFFFENGKPQSSLQVADPKKKLYDSKEYFENGNIKEQGQLHYNKGIGDFQKEGKWQEYDKDGKLIAERVYSKGDLASEKTF
jgi:antitoxin component YwqK of YwqJK toxin-antitoxin module